MTTSIWIGRTEGVMLRDWPTVTHAPDDTRDSPPMLGNSCGNSCTPAGRFQRGPRPSADGEYPNSLGASPHRWMAHRCASGGGHSFQQSADGGPLGPVGL